MSDTEVSVACSLDADALATRRKGIRERVLAHARSTHDVAGGVELRLEATRSMRDTLDEFIALEKSCCSFLHFDISELAGSDELALIVSGPEGAEAMIRDFIAGSDAENEETWPRQS